MMIAMARSGSSLFYQVDTDADSDGQTQKSPALAVVVALLLMSPLMVISAGPLTTLTQQTAAQYEDRGAYINAVLQQSAVTRE
jgi:multicomponent K+:H+ antiporter subunit D